MGIFATGVTAAGLSGATHAATGLTQVFTFGPTGYALLTVALVGILWRFLRPKNSTAATRANGHGHDLH